MPFWGEVRLIRLRMHSSDDLLRGKRGGLKNVVLAEKN